MPQRVFAVFVVTWRELTVPLAVGILGSLLCDFGKGVSVELFVTVAQIAPVFLVVMLLSELFMMQRFVEEVPSEDPAARWYLGELLANRQFALLLGVEIPALVAIGLGHSTTFLTLWMSIALVFFFWAFRKNQAQHYSMSARSSRRSDAGSGP
jgi:hypothetical protein